MKNKKGQQTMSLPFGVIFSLFLIAVFMVIAFIAINIFLDFGDRTSVGTFYKSFQDEVDEAWNSQSYSSNFKIELPEEIELVCFANLSADINGPEHVYEDIGHWEYYDHNIFMYPPGGAGELAHNLIDNINITKTVENKNPLCFRNGESFTIKKDFYDKLVFVS